MKHLLTLFTSLAFGLAALSPVLHAADTLVAESGDLDRLDALVRLDIPIAQVPRAWLPALRSERRLLAHEVGSSELVAPTFIQVDPIGSVEKPEGVRLTWLLRGRTPAGQTRRFTIGDDALVGPDSPWSARLEESEGVVAFDLRGQPLLRYRTKPVVDPAFPDPKQARAAYIHPAYSPAGHVVTGDYSKLTHPHHRGFFLAYTKSETGPHHPDFWNIQSGTGKITLDRVDAVESGPVTARFVTQHIWEVPGSGPVLRERWEVEAHDVPGAPYRIFDLTSTQQAVGQPLVLPTYRYGGMAYRGPDSFHGVGILDVLTSEGLDRVEGDQKPARWVDMTGPIAPGSPTYAGAAVLDHPSNPHHPTPARIHPSRIPFFVFTPSHDQALTIPTSEPTVFRYRVVLHDGRPDGRLDDRLWNDFAHPPTARFEPGAAAK